MPALATSSAARTAVTIAATLALVVTGWLLGHGGTSVPPAAAATGDPTAATGAQGITVSGTGEVTGRPDTLVADFGTEATGSTVSSALSRADHAMTARHGRAAAQRRRQQGPADLRGWTSTRSTATTAAPSPATRPRRT